MERVGDFRFYVFLGRAVESARLAPKGSFAVPVRASLFQPTLTPCSMVNMVL